MNKGKMEVSWIEKGEQSKILVTDTPPIFFCGIPMLLLLCSVVLFCLIMRAV